MAKTKESTTSSFPKMGDEGIPHSVVNLSGQRSPYTMPGKGRGSVSTDKDPGAGTKANRSASLIKEAQGPVCKPQQKISFPNSPEASKIQRNVRTVPSSIGNRDFWAKRAEGPRISK